MVEAPISSCGQGAGARRVPRGACTQESPMRSATVVDFSVPSAGSGNLNTGTAFSGSIPALHKHKDGYWISIFFLLWSVLSGILVIRSFQRPA